MFTRDLPGASSRLLIRVTVPLELKRDSHVSTIFTFWEPRDKVTPYLQLCRETWDKRLADHEIVVLDYSNLGNYLAAGVFDLAALERVPLAMQKDAVMVAVLHRHGGLFMDMDTLIVDDIAPVLQTLRRTGVVMFAQHLAFVAARPGAALMTPWLDGVGKNLTRIANGETDPATVPWDYLGNAPLTSAYFDLLDRSRLLRMIRRSAIGRRCWPSASATPRTAFSGPMMGPTRAPLWKRAARAIVGASFSDQLIMLDRSSYGFIAESRDGTAIPISSKEQYLRFWFEEEGDTDKVLRPGTSVIGLHHGWTPAWYREFSRDEVLAHGCLLSRTLARLLDR